MFGADNIANQWTTRVKQNPLHRFLEPALMHLRIGPREGYEVPRRGSLERQRPVHG